MGAVNVVTGRVPLELESQTVPSSDIEGFVTGRAAAALSHDSVAPDDGEAFESYGASPAETPRRAANASPSGTATSAAEVASADRTEPHAADSARLALTYQRLARIFAAMKPTDAAEVLTQLEDAQIEQILLSMQERNAAPILAAMDAQRVASVSRRALEGRR
jgi:hypothetical protein